MSSCTHYHITSCGFTCDKEEILKNPSFNLQYLADESDSRPTLPSPVVKPAQSGPSQHSALLIGQTDTSLSSHWSKMSFNLLITDYTRIKAVKNSLEYFSHLPKLHAQCKCLHLFLKTGRHTKGRLCENNV